MSRIWDVPCRELDDIGLLAEHRELHGVWAVITGKKKGYARHPETLRWHGHLSALAARHDEQVREMARREWPSGTRHRSPLDRRRIARGDSGARPAGLLSLAAQRVLLRLKHARRSRSSRGLRKR